MINIEKRVDKRNRKGRARPMTELQLQILHEMLICAEKGDLFDPAVSGFSPWSMISLRKRSLAKEEGEGLWRPTLKGLTTAREIAHLRGIVV